MLTSTCTRMLGIFEHNMYEFGNDATDVFVFVFVHFGDNSPK